VKLVTVITTANSLFKDKEKFRSRIYPHLGSEGATIEQIAEKSGFALASVRNMLRQFLDYEWVRRDGRLWKRDVNPF